MLDVQQEVACSLLLLHLFHLSKSNLCKYRPIMNQNIKIEVVEMKKLFSLRSQFSSLSFCTNAPDTYTVGLYQGRNLPRANFASMPHAIQSS